MNQPIGYGKAGRLDLVWIELRWNLKAIGLNAAVKQRGKKADVKPWEAELVLCAESL